MTLTRSDLGPHARETAAVRARPDGHNRAWGFVWRNARFIMRPSKHMPASVGRSSPPRPAAPSTAPLRSTGGGIISIENNRQTGGRTERERERRPVDRSTDPQTQRLRKCASPSPGQRPARIVSVSRCKAFAQFLALQVKFHRMRVPKLGHA